MNDTVVKYDISMMYACPQNMVRKPEKEQNGILLSDMHRSIKLHVCENV